MIRLIPRTVVALVGSLALFAMLPGVRPAWSAAQAGDLVAAYSFNEGSGTGVADASGNGNAGVVQGAVWSSAGKFGGALSGHETASGLTVSMRAPGIWGIVGRRGWAGRSD